MNFPNLVLAALKAKEGSLVTWDELHSVLWPDPDKEPETSIRIVAQSVREARKLLEEGKEIRSVRGKGYVMEKSA